MAHQHHCLCWRIGHDVMTVLSSLSPQGAVEYVGRCWLPARSHVRSALEALSTVDASCQIMRLEVVSPWKEHLYQLEEEMALSKQVLFCLYKDDREGKWRVQAVSVSTTSFDNRRSMPAAWRGLRDDKLSEAAGIPGCVFCHANGFIGGELGRVDGGGCGMKQLAASSSSDPRYRTRYFQYFWVLS